MKKICFVMYDVSVLGGAEQVGVQVADALSERYDVSIYSLCMKNKTIPYDLSKKVKLKNGSTGVYRIRQLVRSNFFKFISWVKKSNIDVVIAIGGYAAAITSVTRPFTKAKYVFCDHGALMNQWNEKDITFLRWMCSNLCHKIVVLTDTTKDDYIKHFKIPQKKIERIYNWINPELSAKNNVYNKESRKILSVGRFGPEKGYDLLVKVAEQVLSKFPDWDWDIYGDGEKFNEIQEWVREHHLDDRLNLKGNVKSVNRIFEQYAMFVLTSYREGLPLVLLEAKINRLPMISFDIDTGPREIIDKENGLLIPPYRCDLMAEAIESLIQNEEYRIQLSNGTRENLEKFEFENIIQQWLDLVETL